MKTILKTMVVALFIFAFGSMGGFEAGIVPLGRRIAQSAIAIALGVLLGKAERE